MSLITPDFGLLVWMTLIFGIVFFVLAKWGFPMITGSVEKRAQRIGESIKAAKEAEEKLRNLAEEQSRMIEETRQEQSRILKGRGFEGQHRRAGEGSGEGGGFPHSGSGSHADRRREGERFAGCPQGGRAAFCQRRREGAEGEPFGWC